MKRWGVFVAGALAASAVLAGPATATASETRVACVPESLTLVAGPGTVCLTSPTPKIDPPVFAVRELNGSQWAWCLFFQPNYQGSFLRVEPFSSSNIGARFASGRTC